MAGAVVVDTESKRLASEVPGGWNSIHLMGFACGVVYSINEDSYMIYDESELDEFKNRLISADEIVTFNGPFDFALAFELVGKQIPKEFINTSNDLYRRICIAANKNPALGHRGFGLGAICERTIGRGKIEDGADAPQLFRTGKIARLHSYCASDVRLTRDLNNHINQEGWIVGPNGQRIIVPKWRESQRSQSLPQSAGRSAGLI
jgi:hypothetical protein